MTAPKRLALLAIALLSFVRASGAIAQVSSEAIHTELPTESQFPMAVIRPSVGEIFFGETDRIVTGVLGDVSILQTPILHLSASAGALYSGLGDAVAANPASNNYLIQIPLGLKLSVQPDSQRRIDIGPHVGANLIRSSGGLSEPFGSSSMLATAPGTHASWDAHPSFGADISYAFSKDLDVNLRYDTSILSAFNLQTLTVGLGWIV